MFILIWVKFRKPNKEFKKTIQLDSNFIHAYNGLASMSIESPSAILNQNTIVKKPLELDSNYISGLNSLAILYKLTKRFDEAEQLYHKVIRLDTTFAKAYGNLGNLLSAQGRYPESRKAI
jgi:tetratricopeptide (TPR) repeat protein